MGQLGFYPLSFFLLSSLDFIFSPLLLQNLRIPRIFSVDVMRLSKETDRVPQSFQGEIFLKKFFLCWVLHGTTLCFVLGFNQASTFCFCSYGPCSVQLTHLSHDKCCIFPHLIQRRCAASSWTSLWPAPSTSPRTPTAPLCCARRQHAPPPSVAVHSTSTSHSACEGGPISTGFFFIMSVPPFPIPLSRHFLLRNFCSTH